MIYIPIWIDLKVTFRVQADTPHRDLHSNMDRFERTALHIMCLQGHNLHSNMDRFERGDNNM